MPIQKPITAIIIGAVLLLSGVAFSQPQFKPPVNLGPKINSSFYESDPFWDGPRKRLYFVSARDGSEDLWYSDWTDTGWTDAQKLAPEINTLGAEHSPSVTPDGKKLYFVRCCWDILVSEWDSAMTKWGTPTSLPCPVNTPGAEFSGKIAPDSRTLYFFSTHGSCDSFLIQSGLLYSVWDGATGWSQPQSLGPNINTGNFEDYPSVTGNSGLLYFERKVSDGISIFVSQWTGTSWGPAADLRTQVGGRAGTPSITPSGDSLFFTGSPDLGGFGNGDIFMMELVPTGIEEDKEKSNLPRAFELYQNYPNPFNAQTQISLFISKRVNDEVNLTVYNVLGQPVRRLLENQPAMGKIQVVWDGRDNSGKEVSSGIYLYELRVGNERIVKKAVLIR